VAEEYLEFADPDMDAEIGPDPDLFRSDWIQIHLMMFLQRKKKNFLKGS
jgi:hypothetical protein